MMKHNDQPYVKRRRIMACLVLFALLAGICAPLLRAAEETKRYEYSWESLKKITVPEWFEDAKLGIFIHWGAYSAWGYRVGERSYAEWIPHAMYRNGKLYDIMDKTFGAHPPEFGYKDLCARFKAEKWDPEAWAELFHKAGAKYIVPVAEHHDGFAMWDSDLTPWCAAKMGPKRDLIGELEKAVRKKGMKYAPSYHRERHPSYYAEKKYIVKSKPSPDIAEEIKRVPEAEKLYGPFEYSDEFIADFVARWKEIQDKYKPDFMWIDDVPLFYWTKEDRDAPQTRKFHDACMRMIADYFNAAEGWGKEVYLNNKGKNLNWPAGIGCLERDNLKLDTIGPKWENPATLGTSYGYAADEEENDKYKSPTQLVQLLCDVVSKNGNLLLNIGPRGDGVIPEGMRKRLLALGKWLDVNGEAIYGTRPWDVFGEGEGKPGPAKMHAVPIRPKEIRYTRKGKNLYALSMNKPALPLLLTATAKYSKKDIEKITLLGSDQEIKWHVAEEGISIDGPAELKGSHVWAFRIQRKSDR